MSNLVRIFTTNLKYLISLKDMKQSNNSKVIARLFPTLLFDKVIVLILESIDIEKHVSVVFFHNLLYPDFLQQNSSGNVPNIY